MQIVHHAKRIRRQEVRRGGKTVVVELLDPVGAAARSAIGQVGIRSWDNTKRWQNAFFDRTDTTISHNKFIVLLKDDMPVSVWTGSTNFTAGGIFGQSNVGHVVRNKEVARRYFDYWNKLKTDPPRNKPGPPPDKKSMYDWNVQAQPDRTPDHGFHHDDLQPAPDDRHAAMVCRSAGGSDQLRAFHRGVRRQSTDFRVPGQARVRRRTRVLWNGRE